MVSRAYPGAPSWVRPLGTASLVIGLEAAGRVVLRLNLLIRLAPFSCHGRRRGAAFQMAPEIEFDDGDVSVLGR
ncbi:hypothetical protein GCM10023259_022170 [Thermocatellispora tengchongensis]